MTQTDTDGQTNCILGLGLRQKYPTESRLDMIMKKLKYLMPSIAQLMSPDQIEMNAGRGVGCQRLQLADGFAHIELSWTLFNLFPLSHTPTVPWGLWWTIFWAKLDVEGIGWPGYERLLFFDGHRLLLLGMQTQKELTAGTKQKNNFGHCWNDLQVDGMPAKKGCRIVYAMSKAISKTSWHKI